ncbi:alpha-E domain-containing protein [Endothiovibrio diazotrophicus]
MLSRVAERLYWFARYVERVENTARLMLVRHQLILDLPTTVQPGWELLVKVLGAEAAYAELHGGRPTEKNVIRFVFGDRDNHSSILSSLGAARENVRTSREVLPSDTWERVNSLYLSVAQRANRELPRSARHKVLNDVIQRCQQLTGMLAGCMTHDAAYQFIRIGRNLERGDMGSRIVDVGGSDLMGDDEERRPFRNALWISVLKSQSGYQAYRLNVRHTVRPEDVLEFLLRNPLFPRSLLHTLGEIATSMERLPRHEEPLEFIRETERKLAATDVGQLRGEELHQFIDNVQRCLNEAHGAISGTWFHPD